MAHTALHPKDWRKGHTITINGELYQVNNKPKKAIDGSWIVFTTNQEGKAQMHYIKEEQVEGLRS